MKFQEVQPSDDELRVMLETGFVLREMGKFAEAADIFRGVAEFIPNSDVPLVGLGTVEFQQGHFDEAYAAYEEALRVKPDSVFARVHRAEALLFQGKRDEAEPQLQEIVATAADSPHSRTAQALLDIADLINPIA